MNKQPVAKSGSRIFNVVNVALKCLVKKFLVEKFLVKNASGFEGHVCDKVVDCLESS
jgi:hypothetical protein